MCLSYRANVHFQFLFTNTPGVRYPDISTRLLVKFPTPQSILEVQCKRNPPYRKPSLLSEEYRLDNGLLRKFKPDWVYGHSMNHYNGAF